MDKYNRKKQSGTLFAFIGESTRAKASGLTYTLSAFTSTLVAFLVMLVLFMSGVMATEGAEESDLYLYCSYLISPISFLLVACLILRFRKISVREAIKSQACKPRFFLIAVGLQIGLLSLSELNAWFLRFLEGIGYQDTPILLPNMDGVGFVGVLIVIALLPAVFALRNFP